MNGLAGEEDLRAERDIELVVPAVSGEMALVPGRHVRADKSVDGGLLFGSHVSTTAQPSSECVQAFEELPYSVFFVRECLQSPGCTV